MDEARVLAAARAVAAQHGRIDELQAELSDAARDRVRAAEDALRDAQHHGPSDVEVYDAILDVERVEAQQPVGS